MKCEYGTVEREANFIEIARNVLEFRGKLPILAKVLRGPERPTRERSPFSLQVGALPFHEIVVEQELRRSFQNFLLEIRDFLGD